MKTKKTLRFILLLRYVNSKETNKDCKKITNIFVIIFIMVLKLNKEVILLMIIL